MPTRPFLWMNPGMMPILHSSGVMIPGQLGPMRRGLVRREGGFHAHHVIHRDALGDADDELAAGIRRFEDGVGGKGRRHIDHADRGAVLATASWAVSNTGNPKCS